MFRLKNWLKEPKSKAIIDPDGEIISDLNPDGSEILDPVPMAPAIGHVKTKSMMEIVREMVQSEHLRRAAEEEGFETFEESEDFDTGDDDIDVRSQWENDFDPSYSELKSALDEDKQARAAAPVPEPKAQATPLEPKAPSKAKNRYVGFNRRLTNSGFP